MNRIEKLIAELCPNGVEWKKLGEVCGLITTGKLNANVMEENGIYPFFTCDERPYRINTYAFDLEAILISGNGSKVGHLNYYKGKFNAYQRTYVLGLFSELIRPMFLFHFLKGHLKNYIFINSRKGSVPYITLPMLQNFPIPIPPLPIQEEIVKILDTFTELEAELQAELEARKKQYEYYRNKLLTPVEHNGRWYLNGKEVEWKKLGEVCGLITTGKLNANAMEENGIYPFFTCDEKPYRINTYAFDLEAILISGNGSKVGHLNYYKGKFNAYQRTYVLGLFSELIRPMFLFHFLKGHLKNYIFKNSRKGSVPYITLPMLQNFPIPIPPLPIQEEIVKILDTFTALEAELEAELEARRKQYEYYRNKLLQFPPFQKC